MELRFDFDSEDTKKSLNSLEQQIAKKVIPNSVKFITDEYDSSIQESQNNAQLRNALALPNAPTPDQLRRRLNRLLSIKKQVDLLRTDPRGVVQHRIRQFDSEFTRLRNSLAISEDMIVDYDMIQERVEIVGEQKVNAELNRVIRAFNRPPRNG